jgi:RNA-editing ligase
MQFHEFQKIPASSSEYVLSKKEETRLFRQEEWVAMEKVHGANFSVYHQPSSRETRFAKRTAFLNENEYFYGWETICDSIGAKIVKVASQCVKKTNSYVILYGELFGGFYPSEENADIWTGAIKAGRINGNNECLLPLDDRAVQEGIYYTNKLDFVIFDVAVVDCDPDMNHVIQFLDYDRVQKLCAFADLLCLKPLLRGTYKQVSSFPYASFDSTLGSTLLDMPRLPTVTNAAEGIVIKPVKTFMVYNSKGKSVRCLIKLKNPSFAEMGSDFSMPKVTTVTRLCAFVNGNRIACLLSKYGGRVTTANVQELVEKLVEDVLEDFYIQFPNAISQSLDWDADLAKLHEKCQAALDREMS